MATAGGGARGWVAAAKEEPEGRPSRWEEEAAEERADSEVAVGMAIEEGAEKY